LQANISFEKLRAQQVDVFFNDIPAFFDKHPIEPIKPRGLVWRHILDNVINAPIGEWGSQFVPDYVD
jgi:hypothetical protein